MRTSLGGVRRVAWAAGSAALSVGCTSVTEVHVVDPHAVTVGVDDIERGRVELPRGEAAATDARVAVAQRWRNDACGADGPVPLHLRREASGATHIEVPTLRGHTEDEVVSADGYAHATYPPMMGTSAAWEDRGRELVLRSSYTCTALTTRSRSEVEIHAFDVWMRTPRENVERVVTRDKPERAFGWLLVGVSAPFAIGAALMLASRDPAQQKFGAFVLGTPALAFGGSGALLLTFPERVTSRFP